MRARWGSLVVLAFVLAIAPAVSARTLDKVDGALLAVRSHAKTRVGGLGVRPTVQMAGGRALVDVYVHGAVLSSAQRLRRLGMHVTATSSRAPERMVEGWLPLSRLRDAAALHATQAVMSIPQGLTNTGSVLSQGDAAHHGPQARAFGPNGQGVPVGIVSDSIDRVGGGVAASQAAGDLPANVQIVQDGPPVTSNDEGRAMAEIVYDTAPGIPEILFGTGTGTPLARADNIDAMVADGARVIADDTVFLTEPFFQDGVVAQAVDRAKANGTAYFVSAGNRARQSWEGTFADNGSGLNDFGGGDTTQTVVNLLSGQSILLVLQWAEPFGGANTDFAIDLTHGVTTQIFDANNTATTHIPREVAQYKNMSGVTETIQITIRRVSGTASPLLKWIANTGFTFAPAEHNTASEAIDPDAASARGSLAVAAVNQGDAGHDSVEPFSSRGPSVRRLFDASGNPITPDVRTKPDIAGADAVNTSLSGFAPFFGTSAAAPSAAGVGALLLSAYPTLTVDQLYAAMRNGAGASDCTGAGLPDADCGFGFIFADSKMFGLDATPPNVTPTLSPATPDGQHGWYRQPVGVTWSVSDDRSPSSAGANCAPATIDTDTVATLTCTGTSSGGPVNGQVTIRRDNSPPTAPAFTGIRTGTFNAKRLPSSRAVGCTASDPTSGVDSCTVTGFSRRPGRHTLTAVAVNDAALQATSKLSYRVNPYAVRGISVTHHISLAAIRGGGLPVTLRARAKGTATLTLMSGRHRVGRARGRFKRGATHLRVRAHRSGALTLVVKTTSASASNRTFTERLLVSP